MAINKFQSKDRGIVVAWQLTIDNVIQGIPSWILDNILAHNGELLINGEYTSIEIYEEMNDETNEAKIGDYIVQHSHSEHSVFTEKRLMELYEYYNDDKFDSAEEGPVHEFNPAAFSGHGHYNHTGGKRYDIPEPKGELNVSKDGDAVFTGNLTTDAVKEVTMNDVADIYEEVLKIRQLIEKNQQKSVTVEVNGQEMSKQIYSNQELAETIGSSFTKDVDSMFKKHGDDPYNDKKQSIHIRSDIDGMQYFRHNENEPWKLLAKPAAIIDNSEYNENEKRMFRDEIKHLEAINRELEAKYRDAMVSNSNEIYEQKAKHEKICTIFEDKLHNKQEELDRENEACTKYQDRCRDYERKINAMDSELNDIKSKARTALKTMGVDC